MCQAPRHKHDKESVPTLNHAGSGPRGKHSLQGDTKPNGQKWGHNIMRLAIPGVPHTSRMEGCQSPSPGRSINFQFFMLITQQISSGVLGTTARSGTIQHMLMLWHFGHRQRMRFLTAFLALSSIR